MLSTSLPTLNAITARTLSAMPCLVTHASVTSDSAIDRDRNRALRKNGVTNAPCPVTTRNGTSPVTFPPEINNASSGSGTLYPNIRSTPFVKRVGPGNPESGCHHLLNGTSSSSRNAISAASIRPSTSWLS